MTITETDKKELASVACLLSEAEREKLGIKSHADILKGREESRARNRAKESK